ncbi:MAG TPA: peptidoglycan DD-metalloendopeptidase family protein [Gaiellaceae bacterium]|nr:peptidoglycan DD-metalloendopeptidase family protein [Gaiellaceae bacterium]
MARRLALGVLLLALVATAPAAGDVVQRKAVVDQRIQRLHDRIDYERAQEGVLTTKISALTGRIRTLEGQVGAASDRLTALEQDLALHRDKLDRLTQLYRLESRRLTFLRGQYREAVRRLDARLVAIYEADNPDTLAVVLSATSFSDLLDQLDYLRAIGSQDRQIADEVDRAKKAMAAARAQTKRTRAGVAAETHVIAVRTAEQRAVHEQLLASQHALVATRAEERQSLASAKESEREYLNEVNALAQVSAQLGAQIQAAQARAAASGSSYSSGSGVSAQGLIWPVQGPVTSPFGMRWGRMHEGIDIAVPYGTPIHAAASGTVIYAGWMSGYGNLTVIDHGRGLATAYAHQSAFAVGNGQTVAQGDTIGYVGCTGHCFGPHLHFEVRVNGQPVDPLGYL